VKWICRMEVADRRPEGLFTTELYMDPVEGGAKKPVWEVEPESMFVFPEAEATLSMDRHRVWGRAWSSCEVSSVDVSFDGGKLWKSAEVTRLKGRAWQTFRIDWQPSSPGTYRLLCRATDIEGRTQPFKGARNSMYSIDVVVKAA
jgi:Mo-co oxidoreductase dimerisation domain